MKAVASLLAIAPFISTAAAAAIAADAVTPEALPSGVQNFYNKVKPGKCSGSDVLAKGFHDTSGSDSAEWAYCQQNVTGKAVFIKGSSRFANMDIDCDGDQSRNSANTPCAKSKDTQAQTAFMDTVATYGIKDLDSNIHPYVVFGNEGSYSPTFDPRKHGIEPLSVMAVVCGGKIVYGVWGDTNGDDGPPLVGESSLAVADACFPDEGLNGDKGHDGKDVLYIAFTGKDAVPGKNGANWKAKNYADFESSIKSLGDKLIARIT